MTPLGSHNPVRCRNAWKVDAAGAFALLAITAFAYLVGVAPLMDRHSRSIAQAAELVAAGEKLSDVNRLLASVKAQLAQARGGATSQPLHLQPSTRVNQRLAQFTALATESRAGLDDIQPGRAAVGSQCDALPVRVAGTGTYPTFARLLHRLREEFPDTGVSGFEVSGNPTDAGGAVKFGFELVWYTQTTQGPAESPARQTGK